VCTLMNTLLVNTYVVVGANYLLIGQLNISLLIN
jgi:hypothetical protein